MFPYKPQIFEIQSVSWNIVIFMFGWEICSNNQLTMKAVNFMYKTIVKMWNRLTVNTNIEFTSQTTLKIIIFF